MYSASVSDYGIAKIDFLGDTYTIIPIACSKSTDAQETSYNIDGNIVSKDEFEMYIKEQNNKVSTDWYEFTSDLS